MKPELPPRFRRLNGVKPDEIADALSALEYDGYPEWAISVEREESWEYKAPRRVGGPNGTVIEVTVTETWPVTYSITAGMGDNDADSEN